MNPIGSDRVRLSQFGAVWQKSLPRPPPVDLEHQRPAEKGPNQYQAREHAEAHQRWLHCDRLDDIGRHDNLQPEQQGSSDADLVGFVVILGHAPP